MVDPELTLFAQPPAVFDAMAASAKLVEQTADGFRPDGFRHEQDLLIRAEGKAVLICGCAHRGVVNIRARAAALLGRMPDAVIGGFHLFELTAGPAADALIDDTGRALLGGTRCTTPATAPGPTPMSGSPPSWETGCAP